MSVPVVFVDDSLETALADCISDYETIANRKLGNADPEMLMANALALRVAKLRTQINYAANQNLLAFASGAALDELAAKYGVFREDPGAAVVAIKFFAVAGAPDQVIPAGTRVKSQDGLVLFATNVDLPITSGSPSGTVDCTCLTAGIIGNGYLSGMINLIVDPQPYATSASNTDTSTGGSDAESDDQLRARIPLANATFSVAGPEDAYKFFAKTASPSIIDVSITRPVPGTVALYVLLAGGVIPDTALLDQVEAICSDKKKRPLNDTVIAEAPTAVNYSITANLTIKSGFNSSAISAQVGANLNAFVNLWTGGLGALGVDVVVDQLKGQCMSVAGMYSVDFDGLTDINIDDTQFANCTGVTVNVSAIVNES
jgi:phage-related baseplate assembly protein